MKKFLPFPVKKKKLFERSEFFFFREKVKILASEREPAVFLFCYLFSFCCQKEKSNSGQNEKSTSTLRKKEIRKPIPSAKDSNSPDHSALAAHHPESEHHNTNASPFPDPETQTDKDQAPPFHANNKPVS